MKKVRPVLMYLTIIAVILGILGVVIMISRPTAKVISEGKNVAGYSLEEIELHSTQQDCWLVENGNVYDITLFLTTYKDDRLINECGKDIGSLDFLPEDVRETIRSEKIGIAE